ncbi:UDP-3-O-acyl-N-acetylglucosamine deacetylase [Thermodesulforhabdus norvegica]|uniref:UDP-3-O-acyl-N-acetylglucosamine deacetylase n=1 Tax=Thermodesulforhabdus norvegica TaxID=39841 RepID=A0A1I4SPY3_9BACT|nr:UDP-3-O-acyl-N-acetylglucosamine deacetylase [Thermodesulforhabdus norvegica]SFM66447.1 UDP-3-O-[3-hydroxymyristoyl] N-acetylglucosamine deacetylase [Thermodesulforhabdus norvegica]
MGASALYQHTLKDVVKLSGIGLHTGARTRIYLKPAPSDTGILLSRTDKQCASPLRALCDVVTKSYFATTIGFNGTGISTVEHLLAALFGCGVDNVVIEVEGPEIPICDGSAKNYVEAILKTGLKRQNAPRSFAAVANPVVYREGDALLEARPSDELIIEYSIEFDHPCIGYQYKQWKFGIGNFIREIAPARTFGFLKDVEKLQSQGLALGGSLENAIVFGEGKILNHEGLRFPDECVRHKVLDFIGDILLLGKPVIGHFRIHKGGHALHHKFLRKLIPHLVELPRSELPLGALEAFTEPKEYEKILTPPSEIEEGLSSVACE